MERLTSQIEYYMIDLKQQDTEFYQAINDVVDSGDLVSPFTEHNIKLAGLLAADRISFDEYIQMEKEYARRNRFLYTFEYSGPRTFGETWAQEYLNQVVPELQKPSKDLDPNYSGEYDFWFDGIRIEVKASRAVKDCSGGKLVDKALYSTDTTSCFNMNFQQIKPACCDVFVWMGVWRDTIRYWILSSSEVENNVYYSHGQHRGNIGEGQLWIKHSNINEFSEYLVEPETILDAIQRKAKSS